MLADPVVINVVIRSDMKSPHHFSFRHPRPRPGGRGQRVCLKILRTVAKIARTRATQRQSARASKASQPIANAKIVFKSMTITS